VLVIPLPPPAFPFRQANCTRIDNTKNQTTEGLGVPGGGLGWENPFKLLSACLAIAAVWLLVFACHVCIFIPWVLGRRSVLKSITEKG